MFVKNIDVHELAEMLFNNESLLLIDVRTTGEMAAGVITTTPKVMPLVTLPMRMNDIPRDKKVVFYCRTGARSAQACMYFQQQGFDNMHNLYGGIIMWAQNGLPISRLAQPL